MKRINRINQNKGLVWHSMLLACLYATLSLFAANSFANNESVISKFNGQFSPQMVLQSQIDGVEFDCEGNELCERIIDICEDESFCYELWQLCERFQEACEQALCEIDGDCEQRPECEEDEEDCDPFPECDEEEEECERRPECDEDEEDCEPFPECDEEEDECEQRPECDEDEEDCDPFPECDEEEEECEQRPECDEDEEDCDPFPECDEEEDECEQLPECDEDEEGEQTCQPISTGYDNPNPIADKTVIAVDTQAANQASRFLSQATLGADYPLVTQVAEQGEAAWLESQFEQPTGLLFPYIDFMFNKAEELDTEELLGNPLKFHMHAWWTQVMTSPDLVRQRVAMALSEIFVVSSNVEIIGESPYVVSQYYDTLLTHSFGNFRDLLRDISLTPAMAIYLSHLNNAKADPNTGSFPDENYAREIMQLFSIGLFELNPDGSRKKDANGNDIPTYGQAQIREFAKIFTGLGMDIPGEYFGSTPCCNGDFYQHAKEMKPLKMYEEFHSTGEKRLLNGAVVPAGQTGMQDIESAIDNLFNHPNVGPFIGKQLIQRLVTSNPSPAYISRVTAAFNGVDTGVRGDMKAVIRAVLLDPEARTVTSTEHSGRLREPFLRLVRLSRAFDAQTPERIYAAEGTDIARILKQYVLYAPSVFNFFQPAYAPNGEIKDAGLVAPEFQITNGVTIIEIKNLVQLWVEDGRLEEPQGAIPTEIVNFEAEVALADDPDALLDRLDTVLTYGTLSENTRTAIKTVLENEPEAAERVKKAVLLIAISPDYAVAI